MAGPLVDILVPARNAATTVRAAIESLQRQTLGDWRVIAVDDGSTDHTRALLDAMATSDPRIRVVQGPGRGVVDALNLAFGLTEAAFLARQDADDVACPDRLAQQVEYLRTHPDCVAVGCEVRHIDAEGRAIGTCSEYSAPELANTDWLPAREPYLPGPFLLARRDAVLRAGGFRPMHVAEDSDLCWRLQELGRLYNIPMILGEYRLHANSVSSRSIRHGRVMAVCSQLAALSARRRRQGRNDLAFTRDLMARQNSATSLAELRDLALPELQPEEICWFDLAISAKLIELAMYRPFEPDAGDCRFIARALQSGCHLLRPENEEILVRQLLGRALRIGVAGRIADGVRLVPSRRLYTMSLAVGVRYGVPFLARRVCAGAAGWTRCVGSAPPVPPRPDSA
jgi:glycosyltransferase involved in cell wall biosynthesis